MIEKCLLDLSVYFFTKASNLRKHFFNKWNQQIHMYSSIHQYIDRTQSHVVTNQALSMGFADVHKFMLKELQQTLFRSFSFEAFYQKQINSRWMVLCFKRNWGHNICSSCKPDGDIFASKADWSISWYAMYYNIMRGRGRDRESILWCLRNKSEKKLGIRCNNGHLTHVM